MSDLFSTALAAVSFNVSSLTLGAFVLILLLFLLSWFRGVKRRDGAAPFPPGPPGWPLLGNLPQLDLAHLPEELMKLSKNYGPVFSVRLGTTPVVVLSGYKAVHEALLGHGNEFCERPVYPLIENNHLNNGVVWRRGEGHRILRRFTLTTLRNLGVGQRSIEERIIKESSFLLQQIGHHEGKPFEPFDGLNSAVANIISSLLFGNRYEYDDEEFIQLLHLLNEDFVLLGNACAKVYNVCPLVHYLPGLPRTLVANVGRIITFVNGKMNEHLSAESKPTPTDYIDTFLMKVAEQKENGETLYSKATLTLLLHDLFGSGVVTTSTTLRWALLLMVTHPEVQSKVQAEIDDVLERCPPTLADRERLPYTNAVVHEVQRYANILPLGLPRATSSDVNYLGFFISKGTYVIPLLHAVLRDENYWTTPYDFNPSHFLNKDGDFILPDAFLPFGAGPRICIGEKLARTELFIFFSTLLQHFSFKAPPGHPRPDLTPIDGLACGPKAYDMCAVER
uniref:cytochrome P450 2F2-like n=1 Tax=Myxine glutinosa TaxID=7769 RepID=UPI00358E1BCA